MAVKVNRYIQVALAVIYVLANVYLFVPAWIKANAAVLKLQEGDRGLHDDSTFKNDVYNYSADGTNMTCSNGATVPAPPVSTKDDTLRGVVAPVMRGPGKLPSLPTVENYAFYKPWSEISVE